MTVGSGGPLGDVGVEAEEAAGVAGSDGSAALPADILDVSAGSVVSTTPTEDGGSDTAIASEDGAVSSAGAVEGKPSAVGVGACETVDSLDPA